MIAPTDLVYILRQRHAELVDATSTPWPLTGPTAGMLRQRTLDREELREVEEQLGDDLEAEAA